MSIKMIVAVDENNGIGYKNSLLFKCTKDLQRFRELTTGHFVVMGRKTYESLPKALPERVNVVVTRNKAFNPKNPSVCIETSIERIVSHYRNTGKQDKDIWVIGGSEIYKLFEPYADEIYLTKIHKQAEHVDAYFELQQEWIESSSETAHSEKLDCPIEFKVLSRG